MDARVPKAWVLVEKADRPNFPPTDDTSTALEKLRRIFRHKLHWNIFREEGVLIGADLVHDREFDLSRDPGEILLAAKETALPNIVPLVDMRGKRPIAFKRVKAVKKAASSPRPSFIAELPPRPSASVNQTPTLHWPLLSQVPHPSLLLMCVCLLRILLLPFLSKCLPKEVSLKGSRNRPRQILSSLTCRGRYSAICEGIPFKSNLQCFHAVRPLLLEGLCKGYSNNPKPLKVYGDMCRHLIQLARRAKYLGEENKDLKAQPPSEKAASLEEELAKVKGELVESWRINVTLNTEKKKLVEDYLGLRKKHKEVVSQRDKLQSYSSGFDLQITQLSGYWDVVVVEASRATKEKSPEFLDALGPNAAYVVYSFVRKYKEKHPVIRSDYEEFQEGYNSYWFAELSFDAPSEDEEEEKGEGEAPHTREVAP
ncbi:hypothetical protein LIER_04667 [Lithospermum erythrorhizon]|uniref:Uncharacterized protein n=1 Tax=Lithospermum erythrorhizon TaxID=34254 RepID=A0AAV3NXT3_LITER